MFRDDFPLLKQDIIYFNNAATTLKPKAVIKQVTEYYEQYSFNLNRGVDSRAYELTQKYEQVRKDCASFLGAETEEIIFTRGTTEGLNLLSHMIGNDMLQENDEVIVAVSNHHSNLIPWQELCKRKKANLVYVSLNEQGVVTPESLQKAMSNHTKFVCLSHVTNTMGAEHDLKRLSEVAHQYGAYFIVDGAQAAAFKNIQVKQMDIDFYAFSSHKLYGPTGLGVLFGKKTYLNKLQPFHYGGEMVSDVYPDYANYKESPYKFEAGTMMIEQVLGFGRALSYIKEKGKEVLSQYTYELRDYLVQRIKEELPNFHIYNETVNNSSIILLNHKTIHSHDIASYLDKHNVIVRAGHHCSQLFMNHLNTFSTLRISLSFYNTKEECDKVVEWLKKVGEGLEFLF